MNEHRAANATLVERLQAGERLSRGGQSVPAAFLETLVDLARRYAAAEKLVLGGPQITYSPVSLDADLDLQGDVLAQAEALAVAERARHDLPVGPILEIEALVEDQGIKVIARRFPEGTTALGAFFFDGDIGPTILLNASAGPSDLAYAVARHYGHFLADYEPYPYIICGRPDPDAFDDPSEVRAHAFALAFLMPEADLEQYREAMGLERHQVLEAAFIDQLQVYFEVDPELILWRFLTLGWVQATQLQAFLEAQPRLAAQISQAPARHTGSDELPDRFVQLVAHAFGEEKLDLEESARLLGVDEEEARSLLGQFRYDNAKNQAASKPEPPPLPPDGGTIH